MLLDIVVFSGKHLVGPGYEVGSSWLSFPVFSRYKTWYIQEHPKSGFDYYLQWPGFNIPSWVLDDARIGKLGLPLRPQVFSG